MSKENVVGGLEPWLLDAKEPGLCARADFEYVTLLSLLAMQDDLGTSGPGWAIKEYRPIGVVLLEKAVGGNVVEDKRIKIGVKSGVIRIGSEEVRVSYGDNTSLMLACRAMPELEKMILLANNNNGRRVFKIGRYLGQPWRKEQWEHVWDEYVERQIQGRLSRGWEAKKEVIELGLAVNGCKEVDGVYVDWLVKQILERTAGVDYEPVAPEMFEGIFGAPSGAA